MEMRNMGEEQIKVTEEDERVETGLLDVAHLVYSQVQTWREQSIGASEAEEEGGGTRGATWELC